MLISIMLNGKKVVDDISPDMTLFKFLRAHGCYSVKCGCETTNCGLCTVFLDEKPVLSCAVLAARAGGHKVETPCSGRKKNRQTKKSNSIWQETSAAVPDMKDSSGESMHLWNIGKMEVRHAGSRKKSTQKRCNGAGDRSAGIYR